MENVSKALLIAGGVLFAILVLTLLIMFHSQISSYYTEQHDAKMNEQITEFNNKFDNYSGQTIRGNDLISIMNRVVDYNRTYADVEGTERVTINIDFKNCEKDFLFNESIPNGERLIQSSKISNQNGDETAIENISGYGAKLVSEGIQDTKLQKLSSNIHIICDTDAKDKEEKEKKEKKAKEKLKEILNKEIPEDISGLQKITMKYYQLTQFKRSLFKCTEVVHNTTDGRVNKISFEAVIEGGHIKQSIK